MDKRTNLNYDSMKKEFLDEMYLLRFKLINEVARLEDDPNNGKPEHFCLTQDEICAELRTRRSQLDSLNALILSYLETHKSL